MKSFVDEAGAELPLSRWMVDLMRFRSVLAATALAGAIAVIPILAQSASPSLHAVLEGTGLQMLQLAPFHAERG